MYCLQPINARQPDVVKLRDPTNMHAELGATGRVSFCMETRGMRFAWVVWNKRDRRVRLQMDGWYESERLAVMPR